MASGSKKTRKTNLKVVNGGDSDETPQTFKRDNQEVGPFLVPYTYELWADGLYKLRKKPDPDEPGADETPDIDATPSSARRALLRVVAREPIWVRRFGRVTDTDPEELLLELAFRDVVSGNVRTQWISRRQIASKLEIVRLAHYGLPVNDENAGSLMRYFDAAIHLNGARVPEVEIRSRTGARMTVDGVGRIASYGFLLGEQWIAADDDNVVITDPRYATGFARGYGVSGSEAAWMKTYEAVTARGPIVRWVLAAAFASPLLRILRLRTSILHLHGTSGKGKSAVAKLALSSVGNPNELMLTWNRTVKSFIAVFNHASDVPFLFDELQAAEKGIVNKVVYDLCLETDRGRATTEGRAMSNTNAWRSLVIMTGEEELIGKDGVQEIGGVSNRVLQLDTPLLAEEEALELHQWLEKGHYGWGGFRFMEKIVQVLSFDDGEEALRRQYQKFYDEIAAAVSHPALQPKIKLLAVVALAEYLSTKWFFGTNADLAWYGAINDTLAVVRAVQAAPLAEGVAERGLQLLRDHINANGYLWFDVGNEDEVRALEQRRARQLFGVLTEDEVWVLQRPANKFLFDAGLPPRRVWTDLANKGILLCDEGRLSVVRRRGMFRNRVYCLQRSALDNV